MLKKIIGNIYSIFIEIILWCIIIAGPIVGGIMGSKFSWLWDNGLQIGIILGILAGMLLALIIFGPIIMIVDSRNSLKLIEKKLSVSNSKEGIPSEEKKSL